MAQLRVACGAVVGVFEVLLSAVIAVDHVIGTSGLSRRLAPFRPREAPLDAGSAQTLGLVSRVLFGQRRKMIRATMKELLATPELLLDRLGIDPTRRAETLSLEEITSLAAEIHRLRNEPADSNTSK